MKEKIKKIPKKFLMIAGVVIAILIVVWIFVASKQKTSVTYTTAKAEKGTLIASVSVSGSVLNANNIPVSTQASGAVKEVYVAEGDTVKKGDKIMLIELDTAGQQRNSQAWANYQAAQSSLASTQASSYSLQADMFNKWDTFKRLAENSTYQNSDGTPNYTNRALPEFHIAEKEWLAAEAKYKNQSTAIAQAQSALSNAWLSYQLSSPTVTAPADGVIGNIVVVPGITVNSSNSNGSSSTSSVSSQQLAVIKNNEKPLATFTVSEVDVNKIEPGQKATITLDSQSGKTYTGKVKTVDKIGSTTSNVTSYPIIIQLDSQENTILPNMAASAAIIIAVKNDVLSVPTAAVTTSNGESVVRVMKNGKETTTTVTTGIASDNAIEITSGLSEGDTVITGSTGTSSRSSGTSSVFSSFGRTGGGVRMR